MSSRLMNHERALREEINVLKERLQPHDTGHIYIQNNVAADVNKNIYIQAKNGENSITCENDGEVYLFSNQVSANQQKLRTSNT